MRRVDKPASAEAARENDVVLSRVSRLAEDVGRWNRFVTCEDTYAAVLVERICHHVEVLDGLVRSTAAEIFRDHLQFGSDQDQAVRQALAEVDRLRRSLRLRMGVDEDGHLPATNRPPMIRDEKAR